MKWHTIVHKSQYYLAGVTPPPEFGARMYGTGTHMYGYPAVRLYLGPYSSRLDPTFIFYLFDNRWGPPGNQACVYDPDG